MNLRIVMRIFSFRNRKFRRTAPEVRTRARAPAPSASPTAAATRRSMTSWRRSRSYVIKTWRTTRRWRRWSLLVRWVSAAARVAKLRKLLLWEVRKRMHLLRDNSTNAWAQTCQWQCCPCRVALTSVWSMQLQRDMLPVEIRRCGVV